MMRGKIKEHHHNILILLYDHLPATSVDCGKTRIIRTRHTREYPTGYRAGSGVGCGVCSDSVPGIRTGTSYVHTNKASREPPSGPRGAGEPLNFFSFYVCTLVIFHFIFSFTAIPERVVQLS
jgi:hypothetical protein